MSHSQDSVSLPEKDYLAILETIKKFNQCQTRHDLKKTFQSQLLSLLKAQGGVYIWIDSEIGNAQIIDSINIPTSNVKSFQDYLAYDNLGNSAISKSNPVMVFDAENNCSETKNAIDLFFKENPNYSRKKDSYLDQCEGALVTVQLPDTNVGVGIHRLTPNNDIWTARDIRIFELLRPHLMHSIETIALREELVNYQSLADRLANVPTPIALIQENSRVVFHNNAFDDLSILESGLKLPEDFAHLIQKEITRYDPPYDIEDSKIEIPFISLPQGKYRLSLSRVNGDIDAEEGKWLLRMKPAIEPYSRMNLLMQETELTGREMEVCCLIRDGFANTEIAARLFISLHTIKNHVRHIHKKMSVCSRAQLVALLNKQAEELE
jgi:DNA-binding CsgD family transcriptional regulator